VLYALRDNGKIEQVSRGVYRLSDLPPISNPDLVSVALRVPKAVICLISALSFHNLTTQVPHEVAIALERGTESPRIDFPPVSIHRFTKEAYYGGIEKHEIDGVKILVYGPEKTIADCFKFRNKLGLDVVLESLKLYKERERVQRGVNSLFLTDHILRCKGARWSDLYEFNILARFIM
jgi:predicted transcriptional regulator of viral defense system